MLRHSQADPASVREKYLLVPRGYRILPQEVQLASGTGTLLRYYV
jgi:hypothetical protein